MESFVIDGGRPLTGTVRAAGNKNGALPILAASMLASGEVRLSNMPRIRDVETMVELMADLGADVDWTSRNEVRVDPSGVAKTDLDRELAQDIRASFLLAGPLLARFGRVTVPPPGGDVIGRRRLDTHIHAFQELGVEVELNGAYEMRTNGLRGKRMYLDEASVMGTENAIMAAVLAEGETIVGHAACEPHIQDLCRFLVSLGARIGGIGSTVLHIEGVDNLTGGEYRIGPEHVEVASHGAGAQTSAPGWRWSSPRSAPRGALRSETSVRSTVATNASTSDSARSAPRSSGPTCERPPARGVGLGRRRRQEHRRHRRCDPRPLVGRARRHRRL